MPSRVLACSINAYVNVAVACAARGVTHGPVATCTQDVVGFNRAGLRMLSARVAANGPDSNFFGDKLEVATESTVVNGRGKRRRLQLF